VLITVVYFSVSGHFGCVYAATLRDNALRNPIPVAVKTIEGKLDVYIKLFKFNFL